MIQPATNRIPRIVIVGAGFAGLFAAKAMSRLSAEVILIDRHNYHLFQPLLYQVATAGLAPSDIAWPIRSILRRQRNTSVLLDEVQNVDLAARQVILVNERVNFDYLVLGTGVQHAYFGHDDWAATAPGLKTIDDATSIRRRLLLAFEQAEMCADPGRRERLMRFVVVGGGPTGVELAGTIAELAHHTLAADFRRIDPRSAKVVLVEAGPRLLPTFHPSISAYAKDVLERLHVEVRLGLPVTHCDTRGVMTGAELLPAATTLWAAGVVASPVGQWLGAKMDRMGRVMVKSDLSIERDPAVFVIGDAASIRDSLGAQVPGIAPAAKQQGRYVARVIASRMRGRGTPPPFHYRHAGHWAAIGRRSAVIDFRGLRLKGFLAWWLWGIAHVYFLIGLPSPLMVSFRWLWEYLTYSRGARLITGAFVRSSREM